MNILVLAFILVVFAVVVAIGLIPFLANEARERAKVKETQDLHKG